MPQLQSDGDLLPKEFNDIWETAPKFSDDSSRIDEASFIQIYQEVDEIFEEYDEEDENNEERGDNSNNVPTIETQSEIEDELSKIHESICNDRGLVSKDALRQWEEVQSMLEEGLLGEDEFDEMFHQTAKDETLDIQGFRKFNLLLDDLFEFEDDENDADIPVSSATVNVSRSMIIEGDLSPGVLFSKLSDENSLVGMDELNLWVELNDMVEDDALLPTEIQELYDKYAVSGSSGKLTEDAFLQLYNEIDNLFEEDNDNDDDDDDDDDINNNSEQVIVAAKESQTEKRRVKEDLLSFLEVIQEDNNEPCGFGTDESDQDQLLNIVKILEQQQTNKIIRQNGQIELIDLTGNWELLYTSSSAMKFNGGLSGIGGSIPNGRFSGVKQKFTATKFISDMEYKERIDVIPASASFDVTVNGSWDLRTSVSLFTGQPSIILYVEPDRVSYGPTSTRADHWKSLGPMNRLDLSYLDDDLRVMRGCTSSDTIFIYQKVSS